jgi:hypothetical protein
MSVTLYKQSKALPRSSIGAQQLTRDEDLEVFHLIGSVAMALAG